MYVLCGVVRVAFSFHGLRLEIFDLFEDLDRLLLLLYLVNILVVFLYIFLYYAHR